MASWDTDLSGRSREIAALDHSPIRVLAGPGTGKTFALMRRVARLIEEGAKLNRILVCTFTRTAAEDLKQEVLKLGDEGGELIRACTIHSYCFELLSKSEAMEITGRTTRPLLKFEIKYLLVDLKHAGLGSQEDCEKALKAFDAAWARLQNEEPGWPRSEQDRRFSDALLAWLRFHEAMHIGEVVPEGLRFIRDNPALGLDEQFDHVLVDEYQDLNRAEQVLVATLAKRGNLIVIGDEDQSIYQFRHANPEGISQFADFHADTRDIELVECRRCPKTVVRMAKALIANNVGRYPRDFQPSETNPDGEVIAVQWDSLQDEAVGLAQFIQARIQKRAVEAGKVLVLAQRREIGYAIRDALKEQGIPAHSFFNEELVDGNPKKAAEGPCRSYTLLTLLAYPDDRVALRCWCGFGSESLRSPAWQRLREHCEENGCSPREALEQLLAGSLKLANTGGIVERYELLKARLAELAGLRGPALVDALFPSTASWATSLRSVAESLTRDDFEPRELYARIRSCAVQPEVPTDPDFVRVMSLHKSKGLTADLVIIAGFIDSLIPSVSDDPSAAEQLRHLQEQRRLFYVAITRPKQTLVLSSITKLTLEQARDMRARTGQAVKNGRSTVTSRFLAEFGQFRPTPISWAEFKMQYIKG